MKMYTVGFIFDATITRVLLMHKNRPDWQKGKMNGIGGRIEEGEESVACMVREAREETGLVTTVEQWAFLGAIHEPESVVDFYAMRHTGAPETISARTDEQVAWCDVAHLPPNVLSNIPWLVAYACDRLLHARKHTFIVQYE